MVATRTCVAEACVTYDGRLLIKIEDLVIYFGPTKAQ
jgi:hypothetical protein